ncbi:hypothetical protein AQUCO_00700663v1 [Aquilegia coerulea]|uniref:Fungal lipase-type domain-containing protein n=1 Tax=Aquilegia coerulea TaxID=218851 RepID=A0A2G5EL48_AQUCA|nr:hypothetical protein AQUCO_00700663v1 [Aquilegia coerulea]
MASEEFGDDFMVLKPHEGGSYDLFKLLFSRKTDENSFTECPTGTHINEFRRRRLIFVSVVVQKMLLSMTKPMAWIGVLFEMWLNCNLSVLLLNLTKGKLVMPDSTSVTFRSTIGNIDKRVELDKNIQYGDSRYYGALSIMASKISYENEAFIKNTVTNEWKMEFLGSYSFWNDFQEQDSTRAFMFRDKRADSELIMIAFRGTPPFDAEAWSTDIDMSWYEVPNVGRVHGGFMKALGLQKVQGWPKGIEQGENKRQVAYYMLREKLREMLKMNENAKFIVTGHSLGGALAVLFPFVLAYHEESWMLDKLEGVYTFGQPRVGDERFGEYMKQQFSVHTVQYVRSVYSNDMVPRLPYDDSVQLFKHFGSCLYYNSLYEGEVSLISLFASAHLSIKILFLDRRSFSVFSTTHIRNL